MSQYLEFRTVIRDLDSLLRALEAMGFKREIVEVHQEAQPMYGYRGDLRPEKAHVIVRRKHIGAVSNDVGFERGDDGIFLARISEYDTGVLGNTWLGKLQQAYGLHLATKLARKKGFQKVRQVQNEDGSVRLVFRR